MAQKKPMYSARVTVAVTPEMLAEIQDHAAAERRPIGMWTRLQLEEVLAQLRRNGKGKP